MISDIAVAMKCKTYGLEFEDKDRLERHRSAGYEVEASAAGG